MLPITLELTSDAFSADVQLMRVRGIEGMNRLSRFEVDVLATADPLDMAATLNAAVTLTLLDGAEQLTRDIGLIVAAVRQGAEERDGKQYTLTLVPKEWLLTQHSGYEIFHEKTTQEIVTELLERAGIGSDGIAWRLGGSYALRVYCTQYDEAVWDFIQRLLAEEGIAYWFDLTEAGPIISFGDGAGSHDGLQAGAQVPFEDGSGLEGARSFFGLELVDEAVHNKVYLREFDKRNPEVLIEGNAGSGGYTWYDYPARVADGEQANARAQVRLEQLQRFKRTARANSNCIRLQPGRIAEVIGCADEEMNGKFLVVEVQHAYARDSRSGQQARPWNARVVMVPVENDEAPTCRPAIWTRRPSIDGVESAMTTGPGDEIHVNDLAEVTIRFPWDRSGITDDKSSDWVRCVNMAMGGTMLLPRVDWEVPVMYYDGDPDRPLVLGRLYNATGVVPYGLPGAAATTSLQSATSPSDGTTQEIRTMDDGGSMEMFVHATRDQTVFVGNDCNTDVAVDETHDVTLNFDLTVDGSQTCDVGSNQTINVGTKTDIKVAGTRSETVGALEHTEVSANREITSEGMYSEVVGGIYAMQCNQYNIDVKGAYTQTIVGTLAHAAALGTGEVVLGGRAESVGGTMNLVASSEYGEEVKMVKKVTAGAHSIKAGGKIMTESQGGDLEIDVGGSAKIKAGKDVVFKASQIVIKAPKIKAEALKMGSSKLESKKKAKIDGTIKRKGGTKIDK